LQRRRARVYCVRDNGFFFVNSRFGNQTKEDMSQKPSIPKGTRDFSPLEMARRNYIFDTIRDSFRLYGYTQIETPAMENLSTLMGKYGEEGDKLLFKIVNSGDFMKDVPEEHLRCRDSHKVVNMISEKGLRYDLTVPFARYVVQHRGELQMPFKRYQIQPVWRADRPQKGRYREFYQCDADVVGSDSLLNEVELLSMIDNVFGKLGIDITIKVNNRKILSGIAEILDASDKIVDITVAIDKIDKIGIEKVNTELLEKGLSEEAVERLRPLLELEGTNEGKLEMLEKLLSDSTTGIKGIEECRTVLSNIDSLGHKCKIELDVSLARGLNYYTGTIIEVKANGVQIGSITGGGRYDNLTGVFGMPGISGVGISFGADRIYDVLNQLDLYPESLTGSVRIMFINFGGNETVQSLKYVENLRKAGISAELYPDAVKMKKQFAYADSAKIPFVGIVGESEFSEETITVKNMQTGEQFELKFEALLGMMQA